MKTKRFAGGGQSDYEPIEGSGGVSGGMAGIGSSLSADQIAGMIKAKKLKDRYGPSQDERDRIERMNARKSIDEPSVTRSADGMSGGIGPRMAKGGKVSSASSRADGCAVRGKTKGTMVAMCGGGMARGKK